MSNKSLFEYELDFDTLIELATKDLSKPQYESYLDYIAGVVDDELCGLNEDEDSDDEY